MAGDIELLTGGMIYSGWLGMGLDRQIDQLGSHFSISVTLAGPNGAPVWPIRRFDTCQVRIDGDVVLTGYVDDVSPSFSATEHKIEIIGRSKTEDLVDCTPDIASGQFKGYTLAQIAASVSAPFGIGLVVETDASQIFPDATLQRGEKAFPFLERLGRLAGVLLTDNANGNLVLTTAGIKRAGGSLVQGQNILSARAKLSGAKRYSQYIVKGQRAIGSAAGQSQSWQGAGDGATSSAAPAPVVTNIRAVALDPLVPRYRPKISLAEAQLDQAGMQQRANWERNYAFGRSTSAEITVRGWRDANRDLWAINRLIYVQSSWLNVDQDLLIVGVSFKIDENGRTTSLKVGPVEGYTPDPGQVKVHTKRGKSKAGSANEWEGAGS